MRFRSFNALRVFDLAARHESFTAAAEALNLSKGAVSYQIRQLESELGFALFLREKRGLTLTEKGKRLWHASEAALTAIEREIAALRTSDPTRITVAVSSYFASRWLSSRIMRFLTDHPEIGLRLQPRIDLIDIGADGIDMAIRWGKSDWTDATVEPLFLCPAFPTAGAEIAAQVAGEGLASVLPTLTLLDDRDDSIAWEDWHRAARLPYREAQRTLVIPDPNVRVEVVAEGRGVAINDALVSEELRSGRLHRIAEPALDDYGYFIAYPPNALDNPALRDFRDWIVQEAQDDNCIAGM